MEDGNAARAESVLQGALERNPGGIEPLSALVAMDLRRMQPNRAISRINAQIQKAPQAAELYGLLGSIYTDQGNTERAEEAFRKQASLNATGAAGAMNLARHHMSQRSFDAAIAELQKVISENPRSADAHTMLGTIYEDLKDYTRAMEHYRTALQNDPNQAIAANNLAFMLAETGGDLREAERLALHARTLFPDSNAVADTLARVYYKRGAFRSAIELLRDIVRDEPTNALYFYHLGMAYYQNGDRNLARETLTQALNLDPNMPQASEIRSVLQKL
jgi:Flp pilus assembly protein TadD